MISVKARNIIAPIIVVIIVIAAVVIYAYLNSATGTMKIEITDPSTVWDGATRVYINYSAIEVHRADAANDSGWSTAIDKSAWLNLTVTLDANKTLGSKSLQPGTYNLIRFKLLNATVTVGGVNVTARVPPDMLQIAITQGGVKVTAGQTSTLLIELHIKVVNSQTGYDVVPDIPATEAVPV